MNMVDKLVKVELGGHWYLGELVEDEDSMEIRSALRWGKSDGSTFDSWLQKQNLGELGTIRFNKMTPYAVNPLTKNQLRVFSQKIELMKWTKGTAIPRLENSYYMEEVER